MEFQNKLLDLMDQYGITQAELARKMKVPKTSVHSWVTGRYKPKSDIVYKLAVLFNVSEAWLIGVPGALKERVEVVSPELSELTRIYKMLSIRGQTRLLAYAYQLEESEGDSDGEL